MVALCSIFYLLHIVIVKLGRRFLLFERKEGREAQALVENRCHMSHVICVCRLLMQL
jgi:hypothetical protein